MRFINTDGLSFIGPGSEWFWTALSGVVIAVTFIVIYRQLRAQNAANVLHRMEALQGRWESALTIHARLVIALWRRGSTGLAPDYNVQVAINWVCGFFEDLAALEERRYIDWLEVQSTWAMPVIMYWAFTRPTILELRATTSPQVFAGFERLAVKAEAQGRRQGEDWSIPDSEIPSAIESQIGRNSARLRMLHDVESGVVPTDAVFVKEVALATDG